MGGVFEFFGKKIAGVDDAGNVSYFEDAGLMVFTDTVFVKVDVFRSLDGDGGGPVDGSLIIVVYSNTLAGVVEAEVNGAITNGEKIVDALVRGVDFCSARAVCCLFLSNGFPGDWAASAADKIAGERPEFEQFKRSAVRDSVSELPTPAGITERGKVGAISGGGRCCGI